MRQALRGAWGRFDAALARWLRPRELLVRSDGRLRYLVLSTNHQLAMAGTTLVLVGWLAFSSVDVVLHDLRLNDRDLELRQAKAAYLHLLAEIGESSETLASRSGRFAVSHMMLPELPLPKNDRMAAAASIEEQFRRPEVERAGGFADLPGPVDAYPADADKAALDRQVASLKLQLSKVDTPEVTLEDRVRSIVTTLTGMIGQRDALQVARAKLSEQVKALEQRLTRLQESQDVAVQRLADRTRSGVERVERTVAMTGLDVEMLLTRAAREQHGAGGPFIPADQRAGGEILLASVVELDDAVQRWERLQFILRSLPLTSPVDSYWVSSHFGGRKDPITGKRAIHEGADLSGPAKAPVLSTAPGRVVFAGRNGGYGRVIEIDHGLGIHTRYAHLHSIAVSVGDLVDYREKIGLLGSSGRSTGPHLHYEVRVDGTPYDPMKFLKAGRYVFKG